MESKSERVLKGLRFSGNAQRAIIVANSHAKPIGKTLKRIITPKALVEGIFSINTPTRKFATIRQDAVRELNALQGTSWRTQNLRLILELITPENER
jgi:hypothetical protein